MNEHNYFLNEVAIHLIIKFLRRTIRTKEDLAIFRMDEIKFNGKNYKVAAASQEHGKYYETNSEYKLHRRDNSDAYIMLIMDESGSLGDHIKDEQKTMSDIVDIIMQSTNQ